MADWKFQDETLGLQPIAETSTTKRHPLGTIKRATHETYGAGEFIYLLGVASTAVGSFAVYNADDFGTTLLIADQIGPVGIAMSANVASQYGWYQIHGKAVGVAAAIADNGNVYATATPGSVDDVVVAGDLVHGAKAASATASGVADFEIARPWVDNDLDDLDVS